MVFLFVLGVATVSLADDQPKPQTDAQLRMRIAGVWKRSGESLGASVVETWTFYTNSAFLKQVARTHKAETALTTSSGAWSIKDGLLTTTISRVNQTPDSALAKSVAAQIAKNPAAKSRKIIDISAIELTVESDLVPQAGSYGKTTVPIKFTR